METAQLYLYRIALLPWIAEGKGGESGDSAMSGTGAHVQTPANGGDSENQSDVITQCRSSAYLCDTIQSVPAEPLDYYECKRFKEKPLRKCYDPE